MRTFVRESLRPKKPQRNPQAPVRVPEFPGLRGLKKLPKASEGFLRFYSPKRVKSLK